MTSITRFPHYHQAENIVTNHVMVMLRMIYNGSPRLLEKLLQALCAEEVTVGPYFSQQIVGKHSIPDGLILQDPMAVFVETKLGSHMDLDQLQRHCKTIVDRMQNRTGNFLIALTTGQAGSTIPAQVTDMANDQGIQIVETSFGELVDLIGQLPITDLDLQEVVQEFTDFVYAQGLVPRQNQFMVGMLTGTSWPDNLANGVYYEPIDRNPKWQRASFLGLYHDKQVSHVGRIVTAVVAMDDGTGQLHFETPETGKLNDPQRQSIRDVIGAAQSYYPDLMASQHRYYVVDGFAPTNFRKASAGGMMGHRYFDIEAITHNRIPVHATGHDAARLLDGNTFS